MMVYMGWWCAAPYIGKCMCVRSFFGVHVRVCVCMFGVCDAFLIVCAALGAPRLHDSLPTTLAHSRGYVGQKCQTLYFKRVTFSC